MDKDDIVIERNFIETWVISLLKDIKEAAEKGENYDLHLEADYVKDIAKAYDASSWIEIY